jgi:hypothetical protein
MTTSPLRTVYSTWPAYNDAIRNAVADLTQSQLELRPSPERWPLWATVGHLCCQRVSWLCGFLGEPGMETTPFPNALYRCPGDEYLEPAMTADELVHAVDSTFAIIERCLDTWTIEMLAEEIVRTYEPGEEERRTRGAVLERSLAHDLYHAAEVNEVLSGARLPLIDLWS